MPLLESSPSKDTRTTEILKHIPVLDGVRGLAILLVLCIHLFWANSNVTNQWIRMFQAVTSAGWIGVDLFFVLSGFLITGILFDSLQDSKYFRNFYGRRALRIFPLYYLVVIALFAIFHDALRSGPKQMGLLLLYLQNTPLWFHTSHVTGPTSMVANFWSLAVEEQFYLVWPVVVYLVKKRERLIWIATFGILSCPIIRTLLYAHGVPGGEIYVLTICRADTLLSGAWLALVMRGPMRARVLRYSPWVFWTAVVGCAWVIYSGRSFGGDTVPLIQYGYTFLAIGMMAFIAMTLRQGSIMERAMLHPWLRVPGKYSYGIYIFHGFVLDAMLATLLPWIRDRVGSLVIYHAILPPVVFIATMAIAMVSYNFYEMPFLRLKKYFNMAPSKRG